LRSRPWPQSLVALRDAIRYGDRLPAATEPIGTVAELVEAFLARHRVEEATRKKPRQLKQATRAFGERRLETVQPKARIRRLHAVDRVEPDGAHAHHARSYGLSAVEAGG